VGSQQSYSKEGTVRHCRRTEARANLFLSQPAAKTCQRCSTAVTHCRYSLLVNFVRRRETADAVSCADVVQLLKSDICGEDMTIVINRRYVLKSVNSAMKRADFSFWKPLRVVFSGEDAEDDGGPRREFFRYVRITLQCEYL